MPARDCDRRSEQPYWWRRILMLAGLPLNLAGKVFAGYQELHTYNKTLAVGAACSVLGLGRRHLAACLDANAIPAVVSEASQRSRREPFSGSCSGTSRGSGHDWSLSARSDVIDLLSTGWSFLLIQAAAIVVFSTDNLIVSHYLGAAEVTPYSVTWRVVGLGAVLQTLVFPALWPAYAEAQARGDVAWIRRTFAIAIRTTIALNVAWAVFLVAFGRFGIRLWAGPAAVPPRSLLLAMAVWSVIAGFCTAQSCLLGALNRTRVQAVASSVRLRLLTSRCRSWLVVRIGSLGVILGTIISYIVVLVVPQSFEVVARIAQPGADHAISIAAPERRRRHSAYGVTRKGLLSRSSAIVVSGP